MEDIMHTKTLRLAVLLVLFIGLTTSCSNAELKPVQAAGKNITPLVNGEGLSVVFQLDFREMVDTGLYAKVRTFVSTMINNINEAAPESKDELSSAKVLNGFDTFWKGMGIDPKKDIKSIFFSFQLPGDMEKFHDEKPEVCAILQMNMKPEQVKSYMMGMMGMNADTTKVKGTEIFGTHKMKFAIADKNTLVMANNEKVMAKILSVVKTGADFKGKGNKRFAQAWNQLNPDTMSWAVISLPAELRNHLKGRPETAMFSWILSLEHVVFTSEFDGTYESREMWFFIDDPESLELTKQAFDGYQSMAKLAYKDYTDLFEAEVESKSSIDKKLSAIKYTDKIHLQKVFDALQVMIPDIISREFGRHKR